MAEKTGGGTRIGTYKYMAPEVFFGKPYGSSADIYSLGLVLYWLLNDRRMPFLPPPSVKLSADQDEQARLRRLQGESLPNPRHGSHALRQIVLKACAYNPQDRYLSAVEMLKDLNLLANADYRQNTNADASAQNVSFLNAGMVFQQGMNVTANPYAPYQANAQHLQTKRKRKKILSGIAILLSAIVLIAGIMTVLKIGKDKKSDNAVFSDAEKTTGASQSVADATQTTGNADNIDATEAENLIREPNDPVQAVIENAAVISETDLYKIYRIDYSTEFINCYYELLQLTEKSNAADTINAVLYAKYEEFRTVSAQRIKEADGAISGTHSRYRYCCETAITYNQGDFFGIALMESYYMGGVANSFSEGKTFDLSTGKECTIADLLNEDEDLIALCLKQALEKYIVTHHLWEEAYNAADVFSSLSNETANFFLNSDGTIDIHFDQYVLGSLGFGSLTIDSGLSLRTEREKPSFALLGTDPWCFYCWNPAAENSKGHMRMLLFDSENKCYAGSGFYASEGYESAECSYSIGSDGVLNATIQEYYSAAAATEAYVGKDDSRKNIDCQYESFMFGQYFILIQLSDEGFYQGAVQNSTYVYSMNEQ